MSNERKKDVLHNRRSVHAYCSSASVCLNLSIDRSSNETIAIDFAERVGNKRYNWQEKIQFQLTQSDLAEFCAFLFYPWSSMKWIHPAASGGYKTLRAQRQGDNLLFSMLLGRRTIHVPVTARDQYFFRNFALSRLLAVQLPLSEEAQFASLKRLADSLSLQNSDSS